MVRGKVALNPKAVAIVAITLSLLLAAGSLRAEAKQTLRFKGNNFTCNLLARTSPTPKKTRLASGYHTFVALIDGSQVTSCFGDKRSLP